MIKFKHVLAKAYNFFLLEEIEKIIRPLITLSAGIELHFGAKKPPGLLFQ